MTIPFLRSMQDFDEKKEQPHAAVGISMSDKPEALRLADEVAAMQPAYFTREVAAELRRLHADAERYRYLRNRNPQEILLVIGNAAGVWIDCDDENGELTLLTGEDADAAIDAAMGKT
jgi:hypothetical protein